MNAKKIVLFVALPQELPRRLISNDIDVVYTGVGKVNAAMVTMQHLNNLNPTTTLVMNFGSAGSKFPKMRLYECTKFSQRDMNATPLAPPHYTPFDNLFFDSSTNLLSFNQTGYECATQDTFEHNPKENLIYDMEAYAIAKVCAKLGFDFRCFKFISDDGNGYEWEQNHDKGVDLFLSELRNLTFNIG